MQSLKEYRRGVLVIGEYLQLLFFPGMTGQAILASSVAAAAVPAILPA